MQNNLYDFSHDIQEDTASCEKHIFKNSKVKRAVATAILSVFTITCVLPTAVFAANESEITDLQERMEQIEELEVALKAKLDNQKKEQNKFHSASSPKKQKIL